MMKFSKFFEIVYLVVGVLSAIEVFRLWDSERNRAYLFVFFACISVFMFFFKRHYRKKFTQRNKPEDLS